MNDVTPAEITAMRAWIADCDWSDLDPDDIPDLPDSVVVRGVAARYDGGVQGFIRDLHW